jgi:predicted DNA binding CopG/RHH family protein
MKYSELVDSGATPTEIQGFLTDSENVSVTLRMPRSLRDSAKEAANLSGMSLASYVKMCLIDRLSGVDRK